MGVRVLLALLTISLMSCTTLQDAAREHLQHEYDGMSFIVEGGQSNLSGRYLDEWKRGYDTKYTGTGWRVGGHFHFRHVPKKRCPKPPLVCDAPGPKR